MRCQYFTQSRGFVGVYDITSRDSFQVLVRQLEHVFSRRKAYQVPLLIVGNKCDLATDRQVSTKEGKYLAKLYNAEFYESSAILRINMDEIMWTLVR